MLHGLTISAFRNFSTKKQWLAPLSRINIIIGSNYSGKPNILRYIGRVVDPALQPGRRNAVEQASIDVPTDGTGVSSIEMWVPFEPNELSAAWQPSWTDAFRKSDLLDRSERLVRVEVSTGTIEQGMRFTGQAPNADYNTQQTFYNIWSAVMASSGGSFAQHWYPGALNRIVGMYLHDMKCHYIPQSLVCTGT